jgi:DnaJ domain
MIRHNNRQRDLASSGSPSSQRHCCPILSLLDNCRSQSEWRDTFPAYAASKRVPNLQHLRSKAMCPAHKRECTDKMIAFHEKSAFDHRFRRAQSRGRPSTLALTHHCISHGAPHDSHRAAGAGRFGAGSDEAAQRLNREASINTALPAKLRRPARKCPVGSSRLAPLASIMVVTLGAQPLRPAPSFDRKASPEAPSQGQVGIAPATKLPKFLVTATGILFEQVAADPRQCECLAVQVGSGSIMKVRGFVLPKRADTPLERIQRTPAARASSLPKGVCEEIIHLRVTASKLAWSLPRLVNDPGTVRPGLPGRTPPHAGESSRRPGPCFRRLRAVLPKAIGRAMDPYHTLGVAKDCTRQELKEAFRAKALLAHPDRGGDPADFVRLREAYGQVIKEVEHRSSGPTAEARAQPARVNRRPNQPDLNSEPDLIVLDEPLPRVQPPRPPDPNWEPDLIVRDEPLPRIRPPRPPDRNWKPDLILLDDDPGNGRFAEEPDPNWEPDLILLDDEPGRARFADSRDPRIAQQSDMSWLGRLSAPSPYEEAKTNATWLKIARVTVLLSVIALALWICWAAWSDEPETEPSEFPQRQQGRSP